MFNFSFVSVLLRYADSLMSTVCRLDLSTWQLTHSSTWQRKLAFDIIAANNAVRSLRADDADSFLIIAMSL